MQGHIGKAATHLQKTTACMLPRLLTSPSAAYSSKARSRSSKRGARAEEGYGLTACRDFKRADTMDRYREADRPPDLAQIISSPVQAGCPDLRGNFQAGC